MKKHLFQILIVIATILGSCATPNEPNIPTHNGNLEILRYYQTVGYARDIQIIDDKLFIAEDQGGVSIYEKNGNFLTRYSENIDNARLIQYFPPDTLLFVYDIYGSPGRITAFNISDIDNFEIKLGITGQTDGVEEMRIFKEGDGINTAWTHGHIITKGSIDIFWNPTLHYEYQNSVNGFDYNEDYYFISGEQLGVYIADIDTFETIQIVDTKGQANDVKFVDNKLFVTCREAGLSIIDIEDMENPVMLYEYDTSGYAQSVDVQGNILAVASGGGGVYVFDVSDMESVRLVGNVDDSEIGYCYKVQIDDNMVYVATKQGVYTISVSL